MAVIYDIEHITQYKYANPVTLAQHRAMFLPRVAHGGRLIKYSLETNVPSQVRWVVDALGNSLALIDFSEPTCELVVTYRFRGVHYGAKAVEARAVDPRAKAFPIQYTLDEWADLAPFLRPHAEDSDGSVSAWIRECLARVPSGDPVQLLKHMTNLFSESFAYQAREVEGTQAPGVTLATKSGTCRDYAWLMIEALRRLGLACRFMSGYLYDSALDGGKNAMRGSASTHAWVSTYLPGAGWNYYDPTNRIDQGFALIPVAAVRHPGQASPLQGSWFGSAGDYLGMDVKVSIHKVGEIEVDY